MKATPLHLTEQTWDAHEADLDRLETVVASLLQYLGFFEPLEDGSEWNAVRAEQRMLASGALPPGAETVFKAMACVHRSILAAGSERELMLTDLLSLRGFMGELLRAGDDYQKARREEVATERYLDQVIGWETFHGDDREELVAKKMHAWKESLKAALRATRELIQVLHEERPVCVEAGLYSAKGAGAKVEFALRLLAGGLHPDRAALIRNDVRIFDRSLKSPTQRAEIRRKGSALRSEVNRAISRIKAIFHDK